MTAAPPTVLACVPIDQPGAGRLETWLGKLLAPCDLGGLVVWRVGWGAMIAWWAWDYLTSGRVGELYVRPKFHFTYAFFDWVRP